MSPQMSVDSLKDNLTNPARTYLFEVFIPNPGGGNTETLALRCQAASIPERSFGTAIHVDYKQTAGIQFPGKDTNPHTWDLTFMEGEDREVMKAFDTWCNKIVNNRTGIGALGYKTNVYLHLLNTDGSVAMKIKLVGAFPLTKGTVALDWTTEEKILIPVTLSYDRWEIES